jgi:AAA15 family ATPase/GTPase
MIIKINLNGVACYKIPATLETDKKVNLIYGLNGTGKSTLSDFLYDRSNSTFSNCSVDGLSNEDILVYSQRFIRDNFYESDNLKGIFTLSKENREAEEKIRIAEKEITKLETEKKKKSNAIDNHNRELDKKK